MELEMKWKWECNVSGLTVAIESVTVEALGNEPCTGASCTGTCIPMLFILWSKYLYPTD